jgi:hypothetical protein
MRLAELFILGAMFGMLLTLIYSDRKLTELDVDRLGKERALIMRVIALEKKVGIR